MGMGHAVPSGSTVFAAGLGRFSLEEDLLAFAGLMLLLLCLVRVKRGHDQKRRRAASTGFYDFDVARYGHSSAGSSLMETPLNPEANALAPTFVSPNRAAGSKTASKAKGSGRGDPGLAGLPPPRPLPAFDQAVAVASRPPAPGVDLPPPPGGARLPIPSTPLVPPPPPPGSVATDPAGPAATDGPSPGSLPLLVQPPPPRQDGDG
jgi:hypothetical protein